MDIQIDCAKKFQKIEGDLYNDGVGMKFKVNKLWEWFHQKGGSSSNWAVIFQVSLALIQSGLLVYLITRSAT